MGICFSKKTKTTILTPSPLNSDHQQPHNTKNDRNLIKKEIFVIKHRVSHEIDRHSDQEIEQNPTPNTAIVPRSRTSSYSKEEVDGILCNNVLSRSNSTGAHNPIRRRRCSRSKRSFDLGFNTNENENNNEGNDEYGDEDEDGALNHHHRHLHRQRQRQNEVRVSSGSKERRISISPSRRSNSKERRISISPSRRSESPFRSSGPNSVVAAGGGSSNKPAKMVSVPATDKSNNAGSTVVKRIHVKRNVSPARTNHRVFTDNRSEEGETATRKSLVEIDNNAARSTPRRDSRRIRKLSRDLDASPETIADCDPSLNSTNPPTYASLLLEDINNFHKKNTNAATTAATTPASFALPECVNKACLIMEAVADLNSSTSSLCSDERWRNPTTIMKEGSL